MNEKKFHTIAETAASTGLSRYFLRNGCRNGSVPCIKAGSKFLINVPALLEKLDAQSRAVENRDNG